MIQKQFLNKYCPNSYYIVQSNNLRQLFDAYPECIDYFKVRPFVLYQLIADLDPITRLNSTSSRLATLLSLTLVTSGEVFGDRHDEALTRKLLLRLSDFEYFSFAAILPFYYETTGSAVPKNFNPKILEVAAEQDYYMAKWALAKYYPDKYRIWLSQTIRQTENTFERHSDFNQHMLICHLRLGNFEECKQLLISGVQPLNKSNEIGPVHWLISFGEPQQIDEILHLLLEAGCAINGWVKTGQEVDILAGRIDGTPLHCAVMTRNLHLVRVLCRLDTKPDSENIDTAFKIASSLHFADVLEILNECVCGLNRTGRYRHQLDQWNLIISAVLPHAPHLHVARLLRHGKRGSNDAMLATFEFLLDLGTLPFEEQKILVQLAILHGCGKSLPVLIAKFKMRENPAQWAEYLKDILSNVITFGDIDAFSAILDSGLVPKDVCFINDKWTLIQICCISPSRKVEFIKKVLQLGCSLDSLGPGDEYQASAFTAAVTKGSYDMASFMLQNGADKDFTSGWLGGQTCIGRLLQQPDLPVSRLRYMLEALPEEGFGHVDYIVSPSQKHNIFHIIASSPWAGHRSAYRQAEIMKYLLSVIGDQSCVNQPDVFGYTPLYFAASRGQLELCEVLIEAGADVQASVCRSPLNGLVEWRETCARRARDSWSTTKVGEKKLAAKLLDNAQKTFELLTSKGATDWRANPFQFHQALMNGQVGFPNLAVGRILIILFILLI
jgi:ankyrin repeat protein